MTCYDPNCTTTQIKLWKISNTPNTPLKYIPFYVCDKHLCNSEIRDALISLCRARFERQQENTIQTKKWILEKMVHTWSRVQPQECEECDCVQNLWTKVSTFLDEDGFPINCPHTFCDEHISREDQSLIAGVDLFPIEETWTKW